MNKLGQWNNILFNLWRISYLYKLLNLNNNHFHRSATNHLDVGIVFVGLCQHKIQTSNLCLNDQAYNCSILKNEDDSKMKMTKKWTQPKKLRQNPKLRWNEKWRQPQKWRWHKKWAQPQQHYRKNLLMTPQLDRQSETDPKPEMLSAV